MYVNGKQLRRRMGAIHISDEALAKLAAWRVTPYESDPDAESAGTVEFARRMRDWKAQGPMPDYSAVAPILNALDAAEKLVARLGHEPNWSNVAQVTRLL